MSHPQSNLKRTRRKISLDLKLRIIERHERGERSIDIARTENLCKSTVRNIVSNAHNIKKMDPSGRKMLRTNNFNSFTNEMERKLAVWFVDLIRASAVTPTVHDFKAKAQELYKEITKHEPLAAPFIPTYKWMKRFKEKFKLSRVPLNIANQGDHTSVSSQLEMPVEDDQNFKDISCDYKPQQIFCVAETLLNWKQMPSHTYTSCIEGDLQDRFLLLLGGNAHGDFKLKPLLMYHLENPQPLKGFVKGKLPVMWKSNTKLHLTQQDFSDWFTSYFCPAVEDYCKLKGLPNKALLVLDAAAGYPSNLDDLSNTIKVHYMASDNVPYLTFTNFILFKTFKAHYFRITLAQALAAFETNQSDALVEFWHTYDVMKAIFNISEAWKEVKPFTMNLVWTELYPESNVKIMRSQDIESLNNIAKDVVYLINQIGPEEIHTIDIVNLLELKVEKPSDIEVEELQKQKAREEFMDYDEHVFPIKALTPTILREAIEHVESAMSIFKNHDPDSGRSFAICRNLEKSLSCYRQLYRKKMKGIPKNNNLNSIDSSADEESNLGESCASFSLEILNSNNITVKDEQLSE